MNVFWRLLMVAPLVLAAGCANGLNEKWMPPEFTKGTPYKLTPSEIAAVEDAIRYRMKDSSSTTFRNISGAKMADGTSMVCGEANSKNSFGGYNGFMPFSVSMTAQGSTNVNVASDATTSQFIAKNCAIMGVYG